MLHLNKSLNFDMPFTIKSPPCHSTTSVVEFLYWNIAIFYSQLGNLHLLQVLHFNASTIFDSRPLSFKRLPTLPLASVEFLEQATSKHTL